MGSNDMRIFVRNLQGRDVTFIVQPSMNIATLRVMVFEDARVPLPEGVSGPGDLRLLFGGKQLEDDKKILDYNITKESTLHLVQRVRGGMAKKGVRRAISKNEKIVLLRAKANYETTGVDQNTAALATTVGTGNYTVNAIMQLQTMEQLQALETAADVTRVDRTPDAINHILVPQLGVLNQQKADLEKAITALEHSYNLGFNEAFYTDNGLNTDPMWAAIEARKEQIQNAMVEAEVQRRMQAHNAAAAAAAAANNGDANMNAEI